MKKLLTSFLLPLMALPAIAQEDSSTSSSNPLDFEAGGIIYTILNEDAKTCQTKAGESTINYEDRKFVVTYGNSVTGDVNIPATVQNSATGTEYTVVGIGSYGFEKASSITIAEGITEIGQSAFSMNTNLANVSLPNSITTLGSYAFSGCSALKEITLPTGISTIPNNAFVSSGLTTITIPDNITVIGDNAFSSCTSLQSIVIPNSVVQIGQSVFQSNTSLTSVTLSESLSSIPASAFRACSSLTTITLPANITSIGEYGLSCSQLTEIVCENKSVPAISYNSFYPSVYSNAVLKVYNSVIPLYKRSTLWSAFADIQPIPVEPTGISVSPSTLTINLGLSSQLTAMLSPEDAVGDIIWSVSTASPEGAITIDESGLVTGRKIGTATVTATCGNLSATGDVVVKANPSELVTINPLGQDIYVGDNVTLSAVVLPSTISPTLTWTSSNTNVATIDENTGVLTALAPGATVITATTDNVSGKLSVTVLEVLPTEITLDKETLTLEVGQTGNLTAKVAPANVTYPNVTWESSDPSVALVADGVVTATGVGAATIRAMCGGYTANCVVTVNPTLATSVTLSANSSTLKVGQTFQLVASVSPDNTTDKTITWLSNNADVATVSTEGVVTALSIGTAVITAECGNVSATCNVTVEATPSEGVVMNNAAVTLKVNQTQQLVATVLPESTTDKSVTWTTSNPAVASVENGLVTALALGSATITASNGNYSATCEVTVEATLAEQVILNQSAVTVNVGGNISLSATVLQDNTTDPTMEWSSLQTEIATVAGGVITGVAPGSTVITAACGSAFATCNVTVLQPATAISLNESNLTLEVGEMFDLIETVTPSNTTDIVVWSSSDADVATVDNNGIINAIKAGETTITATCGEQTATCVVTVKDIPATSVELSQTTLDLKTGQSIQLTATVLPENTTNPTLVWTSSDTSVATVTQDGTVTTIATGTTTITATCGDVFGSCTVTVSDPDPEEIILNYPSATLKAQETIQLTASLPDSLKDQTVAWSSSDSKIATVSDNGLVTAVAVGEATITATCGSVSATCQITVETTPVEMIELNVTEITLTISDTYTLVATVYPSTATDDSIEWSSSNPEVATVDEGIVTALASGSTVITAINGNVYASCVVTVESESSDAIDELGNDLEDSIYVVYNIQGANVMTTNNKSDLRQLTHGIYIINGKKVYIR